MTIRTFYIDPKKAKGVNFSFYRFFGKFFSKFWFSHLICNEEEMPAFEDHELLLKPIYCGVCGTDVDKVMNINVKGVWQMCKFISPLMNSKEGGSIINISSATVFSGSTNWMHYVASKGAVISMSRVMARELGHKNIRVNVIAPGLILTEASKRLFSDAKNYGIQNASLLRNANSNEITGSALFLASHLAKFITGQTIIIDGGKQFI